jgi:SAM-dependent methyltransferase
VEGYGPASYGDAFADVYDEWYEDVSDVEATVDCLARLARGGRVLELGIGTGRLALPLAERGVSVEGIDASAAMVAQLRGKAGGERIDVRVGDMAAELPDGPFAVVFAAFNTLFNLPTAAAQARCLALVAERLEPSGCFAVEAFVPDETAYPAGDRIEVRSLTKDRVVLSVSRSRPDEQRAEGHFIDLSETSGVRLRPWSIRYAAPAELDEMAAAAGLGLDARWADWRQTPFSAESPHHVAVYRRVRDGASKMKGQ